MSRETLLKIISAIEAKKGAFAPNWESQLAARKAELAKMDRGEEVAAPVATEFAGFTRFGDPIIRGM